MFRFIFIVFLFSWSCHQPSGTQPVSPVPVQQKKKALIVRILPLGNITAAQVETIYQQVKAIVPNCTLETKEPLPSLAYYKPRNRYRADSLISWLSRRARPDEVYLGITASDISTRKADNPDYGVMGLGYQPGNACVASSFRLSDKRSFFKVAIHELGHTAGLPHCPVKTCFMRDAEGGNPTNEETGFCEQCKVRLIYYGWNM